MRTDEIARHREKSRESAFVTAVSWVCLSVGICFLATSVFLPREGVAFSIVLGLGIALMPAGLIAIVTSYVSSVAIQTKLGMKIDEQSQALTSAVERLNSTTEYLDRSHRLGVRMVFPERRQALQSFLPYVESYIQNSTVHTRQVVFVGSSLKGVIEETPSFGDRIRSIIDKICDCDGCTCFFLLTHPFYSRYREAQEDRPPTGIAKEILYTISWLEARKADAPNIKIKVYKGTPTCFMICTTEKMVINPYPYQVEAYKCFCLEVEANENPEGIFKSYYTNHFHLPWFGHEREVSGSEHYRKKQANVLDYQHIELDGPIDKVSRRVPGTPEKYGECFIIPDQGSFYVAVNIRALAADIPFDRKKDGYEDIMRVSDTLEVRLLNLSLPEESMWQTVGRIILDHDRNGFWHDQLADKSIFAYSMLGVFDPSQSSPFKHSDDSNEKLRGKPLPVLWTWLAGGEGVDTKAAAASSGGR